MQKVLVGILVVLVCVAIGFGIGYFYRGQRADYRGAYEEAKRMAGLVESLGGIITGLREDYNRVEEQARFLQSNNTELGRKLGDSQAVAGELAVRNRELVGYATELEDQIRGLGVDILSVAEDIGRYIPAASESPE